MQNVEFALPSNIWQGLNTRYPADTKMVSTDDFTAGSFNFLTSEFGVINKRTGTDLYNPSALAGPPKDQYEAIFNSGTRHLLVTVGDAILYSPGDRTFTEVEDGFTTNANFEFATFKNRVYMGNGVDNPQVYDIQPTYGGVTSAVPNMRAMGATAPTTNLTAGSPTAGGSVPDGAHTYKYTFLYYGTEESNGSSASGVQTAGAGNNTIPLTSIDTGPLGVTARKIYRDDNDGVYVLVGTIANNTATTFNDTAALGTLPIPTDNNAPPIWSLVVNFRDRLWVAGVADAVNTLYYSDAGFPDIYPTNNFIACSPKDPISALVVFNDKILVFNRNSMGQVLGSISDDFRYGEISSNIGCIDNRSIQIRTINGVPNVVWLAQLDMYAFDGSNLKVISNLISNELQLNVQQATNSKSKNIQTTQADFQAGTASPGIDLTDIPGTVTTHGYGTTTNPTKLWDSEVEWEGGSSLDNVVTQDGTNTISVPLAFSPILSEGVLGGAGTIVSDTVRTTLGTNYTAVYGSTTGYNAGVGSFNPGGAACDGIAQQFSFPVDGTLTNVVFPALDGANSITAKVELWTDSSNKPAAKVSGSPTVPINIFHGTNITCPINMPLVANTKYWIVCIIDPVLGGDFFNSGAEVSNAQITSTMGKHFGASESNPSSWAQLVKSPANTNMAGICQLTFDMVPIATSGNWTSTVHNAFSDTAVAGTISHTGSFPSGTGATTIVEGANDIFFTDSVISQNFSNLNGSTAVTLSDRPYWRVRFTLTTTDYRLTPVLGIPTLSFNTTTTWISEAVDHTSDITTLDALVLTSTVPTDTSATVTIATSTDNITYSSYTAIGSATARRYSKVKVVLTSNVANTVSAVATSVRLDWSLTSTLISSAIDTVVIPAGWGIFQSDFETNGGTLIFEIRTASSSGGLTGATWETATNGTIITNDVLRWIQWRITISSSANEVPEVHSMIINWLNTLQKGVRVASLFYNKNYYLAAANFTSDTNNIVFVYDQDGTWKIFEGLNISTISLFFSEPYYGDAIEGDVVKWLEPGILLDQGQPIEMDIRTKAFGVEIGDETKTKMLRHLIVKMLGTGARLAPSYSIDGGVTFLPLQNVDTGLAYYDSPADNQIHFTRFTPAATNVNWNYTILFRLYNNDEFPVEIHGLRVKALISERPVR